MNVRRSTLALACSLVATLCATGQSPSGMTDRGPDRQALWHIVHDGCVPEQQRGLGGPPLCLRVDVTAGYAILKDARGVAQVLLIPTARVAGIESREILAPDAPNYFAEAWSVRSYLDAPLHTKLPRTAVSLAINSAVARSQDQFHIHIDCVREDVAKQLREHEDAIGGQWALLDAPLAGHRYMALRIAGAELTANPFQLLAKLPGARADMGQRTLVLVGATFARGESGFVLLEDRASGPDRAAGEELQDHSCAVARVPR